MIHRCRLIDNRGSIRESAVIVDVRSTWFGVQPVPPLHVESEGRDYEHDHTAENGVVVYLEVE